jgi:hypothetical protein
MPRRMHVLLPNDAERGGALKERRLAATLAMVALLVVGCTPTIVPTVSLQAEATPTGRPTASPAPSPTPTAAATPVQTMASPPPDLTVVEPVDGTNLPLAARDGAPGLVSCGQLRPTTLEALVAVPTGAETGVGAEYDVLRSTIATYGDDPEFAFRGQTFREFRLDATNVTFLGGMGDPEGPFSTIDVRLSDGQWRWAGMTGGCKLTGAPGPGWGAVNWTVDPAFADPTPKTRTLHLLATDYECVGGARLRGRLAPAWVFLQPHIVWVQLFAQLPEPGAECTDQKPTKVTVRLPEPLGTREVADANPTPCRGCGG